MATSLQHPSWHASQGFNNVHQSDFTSSIDGRSAAAVFLPLMLSLSLASPQNPLLYHNSPAAPASELREHYLWKSIDFIFPSEESRQAAIASGIFKPENNLPLGIEVWQHRIFVSFPKWKDGVPVTLATIPRDPALAGSRSPPFQPYPNWSWQSADDGRCYGLTSVFRMNIDSCGRLWVLDSGITDVSNTTIPTCPPQLLAFDLKDDSLILRYILPSDQVKEDSLFTNIVSDVRDGKCDDAYVYMTDVWRFALVVYSMREGRSWRITNSLFYPDPMASRYSLSGLNWRWTDGIFGMALSPIEPSSGDRTLLFHPMSSFREFAVPVSVIRNKTLADNNPDAFQPLGEPRATRNGHSSAEAMDRRGVLFFSLVTRNAIGCWNSQQPYGYRPELLGIVAQDENSLNFPNDLKVDHDPHQNLWVISNRLHRYIYGQLDYNDYNFRILTAPTAAAVRGTVCDPDYVVVPSAPAHDNRLRCS